MEITEVRIFMKEGQDKKLKAYATLTFDKVFVVRNVKVIEGNKGLFVAMPSRRLKESCPKCNFKNVIRSKYCNNCGAGLPMTEPKPPVAGEDGIRQSEHKDIAHPVTAEFREYIQKKVLGAYEADKKKGSAEHSSERPQERHLERPSERAPEKPPSGFSAPRSDIDEDSDIEL